MRVHALPGYQGRHVVEGWVRNVGDLPRSGSQPQRRAQGENRGPEAVGEVGEASTSDEGG